MREKLLIVFLVGLVLALSLTAYYQSQEIEQMSIKASNQNQKIENLMVIARHHAAEIQEKEKIQEVYAKQRSVAIDYECFRATDLTDNIAKYNIGVDKSNPDKEFSADKASFILFTIIQATNLSDDNKAISHYIIYQLEAKYGRGWSCLMSEYEGKGGYRIIFDNVMFVGRVGKVITVSYQMDPRILLFGKSEEMSAQKSKEEQRSIAIDYDDFMKADFLESCVKYKVTISASELKTEASMDKAKFILFTFIEATNLFDDFDAIINYYQDKYDAKYGKFRFDIALEPKEPCCARVQDSDLLEVVRFEKAFKIVF